MHRSYVKLYFMSETRLSDSADKTVFIKNTVEHQSFQSVFNQSQYRRRRVAVDLRLGLNICEPHPCPCRATITSRGTRGLFCIRRSGRSTRHQQINDAIWKALKRADVPSTKEPAGLLRDDEKRSNGLTLVPW